MTVGAAFLSVTDVFSPFEQDTAARRTITIMMSCLPAIADIESAELVSIGLPGNFHLAHLRARGAPMAPPDDLFDLLLVPFEHRFHGPVLQVPHPAADADSVRLILGACAEPDALNKAVNDDMCAKMFPAACHSGKC